MNDLHTWKHNSAVNKDTARQIASIYPYFAYDFGAGDGFYGKLIRSVCPECATVGIEIEKSYLDKFKLNFHYDSVIMEDIRVFIDRADDSADLAIFGDVLEHLEEDDMIKVLDKAVDKFEFIIINSPVGFQEHVHEIPSENHRCGLDKKTLEKYNIIEYNTFCNNTMFNSLIKGRK